jgi:[1-hydroxy-2-(trimethylamino)ethyl]phosphonate dioxygenase
MKPDFKTIVTSILDHHGDREYNGLGLSVLDHMLQAALEAEKASGETHEVVATLLHDIGHFVVEFPSNMNNTEDTGHDEAGAAILEPYFGPEIVEPIRLHVRAKRYLCTMEPSYYDTMTIPVKHTFRLQGGKMSAAEIKDFEALPFAESATNLRRWCDLGMNPGRKTKKFEDYYSLIDGVLK